MSETTPSSPGDEPPNGWQTTTLGELIDRGILFVKNGFPHGGHNQSGEGVPHLRPFNVTEAGTISLDQIKYVPSPDDGSPYWVRSKDVVFNNTNSEELVGKTANFELEGRYVLSNHMTILRVVKRGVADPFWLSKYLLLLWRQGEFRALCRRHVNQASVSMERLKPATILLPSLAEQRAIAHVLRTVQQAKEATERVAAAARQLKQSLLRHLFTYGPTPFDRADRVALKETEVGPMPEHWELVRLGVTAAIERGKFTHRPRNDPAYYGGATPFIQTGDVTRSGGRVRRFTQTLNDQGLSVSRVFPKGTIVLTIAANIGDSAILDFDSAFPDSLVGITPKAGTSAEYLAVYLQTQKAEMDRLAPRGTQKNINIQFLQPWPVVVPPRKEQDAITKALQATDAKIDKEESILGALDALFQTLLHNLMTGKVRVAAGGGP